MRLVRACVRACVRAFRLSPAAQDWVCLTEGGDISWLESVELVFNYFADRTPGSFVERRETSVVWSYRGVEAIEFAKLQAKDMLIHLASGPLSSVAVEILQVRACVRACVRARACMRALDRAAPPTRH